MGGLCFQVLGSLGVLGVLGVFVFKTPDQMLIMTSLFSTANNFFLAERKISPASLQRFFLPVRKIVSFLTML